MVEIIQDRVPAFCNRLFLVKALGGWRPVIGPLPLSTSVAHSKFRMEMMASVLVSIWKGDIMFMINQKDADFHIIDLPSIRTTPVIRSERKDPTVQSSVLWPQIIMRVCFILEVGPPNKHLMTTVSGQGASCHGLSTPYGRASVPSSPVL